VAFRNGALYVTEASRVLRLKDNRPVSYETFAESWLQEGKPWGRPVDVLVVPDGALLVSDDHGGRIYRISYKK
jgi:glucose/arabinose dehydrogenase